jgi:hypothetical protein
VESLAAPRSLLLASPAAVTKALVWGAVFWVLVAVVAWGERRPSHLTSGGVGARMRVGLTTSVFADRGRSAAKRERPSVGSDAQRAVA